MARCVLLLLVLSICTSEAADPGDGSDSVPNKLKWNNRNFTGDNFGKVLSNVFDTLIREAPVRGYVYYTNGSYPDDIYGFARCFNLSQANCSKCLTDDKNYMKLTSPYAKGFRYWRSHSNGSCYLRYENGDFSGALTVKLSPPPAPSVVSTPTLSPSASETKPGKSSSSKIGIYVGIGAGAVALVGLIGVFFLWRRGSFKSSTFGHSRVLRGTELEVRSNEAIVFKYEELKAATENFSNNSELGQGGFGKVYKGRLTDGSLIAVKRLALQSQQGRHEFVNEITIITGIQHRNLVRLKGYCVYSEERLLVYEFLDNGSLDQLFGDKLDLQWRTRYNIAIGIARGLAYLHEDSHIQIIHRDIKASNILLDSKLNPKISDFGISRLFNQDSTYTSTLHIAGTIGYMAPEYAIEGKLTLKADVFSFGVLLLEIVSGRRCKDDSFPPGQQILLEWVWSLQQSGKLEEAVDERLCGEYSAEELHRAVDIALICTQQDMEARPIMSHVVAMLSGIMALPPLPRGAPRYSATTSPWNFNTGSTDRNVDSSITNVEAR